MIKFPYTRNGRLRVLLLLVLVPVALSAQIRQVVPVSLQWKGVEEMRYGSDTLFYIALEDAAYAGPMPIFIYSMPIYDDAVKVNLELKDVKSTSLSIEEMTIAKQFSYPTDFEVYAMPLRSASGLRTPASGRPRGHYA